MTSCQSAHFFRQPLWFAFCKYYAHLPSCCDTCCLESENNVQYFKPQIVVCAGWEAGAAGGCRNNTSTELLAVAVKSVSGGEELVVK